MTALKAVTARTGATRRRMMSVATLAAGAALALTGCSAGQVSQTADQVAAINGNTADVGAISLRNVHIVYPEGERAHSVGGSALVALSFINNSETVTDELTRITTDLGTVKITPPAGSSAVTLAPQQTVVASTGATATGSSGEAGAAGENTNTGSTTSAAPATPAPTGAATSGTEGNPDDPELRPATIEITGLTKPISPGLTYTMTFEFEENGTVQVSVPVDAGTEAERVVNELSGPAPEGSGGH